MSSQTTPPGFIRERPIPENPREPPLVPGEFLLKIDVRPGLARPCGWDMYFLGSVKKLDLNSTPAFLGSPTTRRGFYDIVDGTTKVICPMCYQTFTTLDLENKHMQGPCEKFREKLMNSQKALENKNRVKKGMKGKKVEGDSGFLEGMGSPGCQEDMESSGSLQSMESSGFLKGMGSPGLLEDERSSGFFRGDGSWVFETERSSRSLECERSSV